LKKSLCPRAGYGDKSDAGELREADLGVKLTVKRKVPSLWCLTPLTLAILIWGVDEIDGDWRIGGALVEGRR
jgi:hypothetical protein